MEFKTPSLWKERMAQKVAEYKGGTGGETATTRSMFGEP